MNYLTHTILSDSERIQLITCYFAAQTMTVFVVYFTNKLLLIQLSWHLYFASLNTKGHCHTEQREVSHNCKDITNNAIFRCLGFAPRSQNFVHVASQQCPQSVRYPDSFLCVRPQIRVAQYDRALLCSKKQMPR